MVVECLGELRLICRETAKRVMTPCIYSLASKLQDIQIGCSGSWVPTEQ